MSEAAPATVEAPKELEKKSGPVRGFLLFINLIKLALIKILIPSQIQNYLEILEKNDKKTALNFNVT